MQNELYYIFYKYINSIYLSIKFKLKTIIEIILKNYLCDNFWINFFYKKKMT